MSNASTKILVDQAKAGDRNAFMHLIQEHDRQIMAVILRFCGDTWDRDDLYQDIFMTVFRRLKSYKGKSTFSTWLYRVCLNRAISKKRKEMVTLELPENMASSQECFEKRAKLRAIYLALKDLKGPARLCFHLFYVEGWELSSIAAVLDVQEGTVKSHLQRARVKIRNHEGVQAWIPVLNETI